MPGTITLKPIQASLQSQDSLFHKLNPYVVAIIGDRQVQGATADKNGPNPHWNESLSLRRTNEQVCYLEVKDKNMLKDKMLGVCSIDLERLSMEGNSKRWYELYCDQQPVGEILIEASFSQADPSSQRIILSKGFGPTETMVSSIEGLSPISSQPLASGTYTGNYRTQDNRGYQESVQNFTFHETKGTNRDSYAMNQSGSFYTSNMYDNDKTRHYLPQKSDTQVIPELTQNRFSTVDKTQKWENSEFDKIQESYVRGYSFSQKESGDVIINATSIFGQQPTKASFEREASTGTMPMTMAGHSLANRTEFRDSPIERQKEPIGDMTQNTVTDIVHTIEEGGRLHSMNQPNLREGLNITDYRPKQSTFETQYTNSFNNMGEFNRDRKFEAKQELLDMQNRVDELLRRSKEMTSHLVTITDAPKEGAHQLPAEMNINPSYRKLSGDVFSQTHTERTIMAASPAYRKLSADVFPQSQTERTMAATNPSYRKLSADVLPRSQVNVVGPSLSAQKPSMKTKLLENVVKGKTLFREGLDSFKNKDNRENKSREATEANFLVPPTQHEPQSGTSRSPTGTKLTQFKDRVLAKVEKLRDLSRNKLSCLSSDTRDRLADSRYPMGNEIQIDHDHHHHRQEEHHDTHHESYYEDHHEHSHHDHHHHHDQHHKHHDEHHSKRKHSKDDDSKEKKNSMMKALAKGAAKEVVHEKLPKVEKMVLAKEGSTKTKKRSNSGSSSGSRSNRSRSLSPGQDTSNKKRGVIFKEKVFEGVGQLAHMSIQALTMLEEKTKTIKESKNGTQQNKGSGMREKFDYIKESSRDKLITRLRKEGVDEGIQTDDIPGESSKVEGTVSHKVKHVKNGIVETLKHTKDAAVEAIDNMRNKDQSDEEENSSDEEKSSSKKHHKSGKSSKAEGTVSYKVKHIKDDIVETLKHTKDAAVEAVDNMRNKDQGDEEESSSDKEKSSSKKHHKHQREQEKEKKSRPAYKEDSEPKGESLVEKVETKAKEAVAFVEEKIGGKKEKRGRKDYHSSSSSDSDEEAKIKRREEKFKHQRSTSSTLKQKFIEGIEQFKAASKEVEYKSEVQNEYKTLYHKEEAEKKSHPSTVENIKEKITEGIEQIKETSKEAITFLENKVEQKKESSDKMRNSKLNDSTIKVIEEVEIRREESQPSVHVYENTMGTSARLGDKVISFGSQGLGAYPYDMQNSFEYDYQLNKRTNTQDSFDYMGSKVEVIRGLPSKETIQTEQIFIRNDDDLLGLNEEPEQKPSVMESIKETITEGIEAIKEKVSKPTEEKVEAKAPVVENYNERDLMNDEEIQPAHSTLDNLKGVFSSGVDLIRKSFRKSQADEKEEIAELAIDSNTQIQPLAQPLSTLGMAVSMSEGLRNMEPQGALSRLGTRDVDQMFMEGSQHSIKNTTGTTSYDQPKIIEGQQASHTSGVFGDIKGKITEGVEWLKSIPHKDHKDHKFDINKEILDESRQEVERQSIASVSALSQENNYTSNIARQSFTGGNEQQVDNMYKSGGQRQSYVSNSGLPQQDMYSSNIGRQSVTSQSGYGLDNMYSSRIEGQYTSTNKALPTDNVYSSNIGKQSMMSQSGYGLDNMYSSRIEGQYTSNNNALPGDNIYSSNIGKHSMVSQGSYGLDNMYSSRVESQKYASTTSLPYNDNYGSTSALPQVDMLTTKKESIHHENPELNQLSRMSSSSALSSTFGKNIWTDDLPERYSFGSFHGSQRESVRSNKQVTEIPIGTGTNHFGGDSFEELKKRYLTSEIPTLEQRVSAPRSMSQSFKYGEADSFRVKDDMISERLGDSKLYESMYVDVNSSNHLDRKHSDDKNYYGASDNLLNSSLTKKVNVENYDPNRMLSERIDGQKNYGYGIGTANVNAFGSTNSVNSEIYDSTKTLVDRIDTQKNYNYGSTTNTNAFGSTNSNTYGTGAGYEYGSQNYRW